MASLTDDQLEFLKSYQIDTRELFDASGLGKSEYEHAMKKTGQHFAFGVTPCKSSGHTIRTKYGHCVQCKPDKIAYMMRHGKPGEVYIAGSRMKKLIKIGSSNEIDERLYNLNLVKYGGASDWKILLIVASKEAGRIESRAQERLGEFKVTSTYVRTGVEITCYELFRCSYSRAKSALVEILPKDAELKELTAMRDLALYE